jgi:hypothetical protein
MLEIIAEIMINTPKPHRIFFLKLESRIFSVAMAIPSLLSSFLFTCPRTYRIPALSFAKRSGGSRRTAAPLTTSLAFQASLTPIRLIVRKMAVLVWIKCDFFMSPPD